MEILTKNAIILGLECFYQKRKSKMADKREAKSIIQKKLEFRECVVCFFLCLRVYETFDERKRVRGKRKG